MDRKIRTRVPILPSNLKPSWLYLEKFREKDASLKGRQKRNFDKRHARKYLPELDPLDRAEKVEGEVVDKAGPPRSCMVQIPTGLLRRNRRHLNGLPESPKAENT